MILVLFEVIIKEGCVKDYLAIAEQLKEELLQAEGFVRAERFESLVTERKILSLSVWESAEAVERWRNRPEHRKGQKMGRDTVFENYAITVAKSLRSYTNKERSEAPDDSNALFAGR